MDQADGDGPLVTEIPAQTKYLYASQGLKTGRKIRGTIVLNGTVVHQENIHYVRIGSDGLVETANELRCGDPIISKRNKNHEMKRRYRWRGVEHGTYLLVCP
jgi:hypothetical protein